MRTRSYMKSRAEEPDKEVLSEDNLISCIAKNAKKAKKAVILAVVALLLPLSLFVVHKQFMKVSVAEVQETQMVTLPVAATVSKKTTLTIPSGTVKANPFLPYRDLGESTGVSDVPGFSLVEPPSSSGASSDAVRVMDTIVSGILYDKFNPSAILNIEGSDYLVKKGDVVNNYKVLAIAQESVTVQLGSNVYKAGIGEILTEGSLNHNDVSNLENKFGGVR